MKFLDQIVLDAASGAGGDGCCAFRREAKVAKGGPAGGDGGRGGNVVLEADHNLTTLIDLHYRPVLKAGRGGHGRGSNQTGPGGDDCIVRVPCGTEAWNDATGELLGELLGHGQRLIILHGGRGGRGNARFATPTDRAPRRHEPGEAGQSIRLRLELKLMADVGLTGLPNAGKSTLIARISNRRPKVADYPFTTLVPNLGVVRVGDGRSFVVADMPGLIEGAHEGRGLGDRFLRHLERTQLLLFLIEARLPFDPAQPVDDYRLLERELAAWGRGLPAKLRLVALNKTDLLTGADLAPLKRRFARLGVKCLTLSAATGDGVDRLVRELAAALPPPGDRQAEKEPD